MERELFVAEGIQPGRQVASVRPGLQLASLGVGVGLALGVSSRLSDHYVPEPFTWFGNLGGLWLVVAFAVGTLARTGRRGAALGALTLMTAVATYYVIMQVIEYRIPLTSPVLWSFLRDVAALWFVLAVGGGAVLGAAGALWRARGDWLSAAAVALLGGALVGESLKLILGRDYDPMTALAIGVQVGIAVLLSWLLLREWRLRWLALALLAAFAAAGFIATTVVVAISRAMAP